MAKVIPGDEQAVIDAVREDVAVHAKIAWEKAFCAVTRPLSAMTYRMQFTQEGVLLPVGNARELGILTDGLEKDYPNIVACSEGYLIPYQDIVGKTPEAIKAQISSRVSEVVTQADLASTPMFRQ